MDEARRRAWAALGIGPAWVLRDPPRRLGDGDAASIDGADDGRPVDGGGDLAQPFAAAPGGQDSVTLGAIEGGETAVEPADAAGAPIAAVAALEAGTADDAAAAEGDAVALVRSPAPSSRRDPLVARLDWPALGDAVAGCRACGLCEGRRNTVFGVGPQPASWMLVGEAPGEQEDLQGEPFVGPAGRLLDQMLAAIAVDRPSQAFIANVLKCRPPRNRDPLPEEVARCEPYLLRQVELLRPRLIVVLGRFAAQSLLRTDASIASLRGRVHRYRAGGREVPMIVTYHPAYLLRNLPDKAKSWADLRLARRTYDALAETER